MIDSKMKYILLVDDDEDILNIQSIGLSTFYGGRVLTALNGIEGKKILEKCGVPELIVSDHKILEETGPSLYPFLMENSLAIPLFICTRNPAFESREGPYPHVSGFIPKPFSMEALSYLVKSITGIPLVQPSYVAVNTSILLNLVGNAFDLYLKLSDSNFVKIIKKGESFLREDAARLHAKGIHQLHINTVDSFNFLRVYEEYINLLLLAKEAPSVESMASLIHGLEAVESVAKRLGWTPEVIENAKKNISIAIKVLSKNVEIARLLKEKLSKPTSPYSRHVGLHAYLSCAFADSLGWVGESAQLKLAMASMMHDLAVDDELYSNIKEWNKKASNKYEKDPETIKYRLHPIRASKLAQSLKMLPPDVDQIILQHHERPDGTGFPRSLANGRISPLASVFIVIEDLVEFIDDGENLETSFTDFITWGDNKYELGHFKKVYEAIRQKLN